MNITLIRCTVSLIFNDSTAAPIEATLPQLPFIRSRLEMLKEGPCFLDEKLELLTSGDEIYKNVPFR